MLPFRDVFVCFEFLRRAFRLERFEEKNVLRALATSRSAEGRVFLVPHFVVEMFAGLEMFCECSQPETVVSVWTQDQGVA